MACRIKEGIFANGGLFNTIFYGATITVAVLLSYFSCAWLHGAVSFSEIKALFTANEEMLHHAQTMAFTTLAVAELFHMLGMSNVRRSFIRVFKNKNTMMAIAFAVGLLLQLAVIEISFLGAIFSTRNLEPVEWLLTCILSLLPLVVHELFVFVRWLRARGK